MTSDGISTRDWNKVEEVARLATYLAQQQAAVEKRLFGLLDRLTKKYGKKASLLATRADFTNNATLKIPLWTEAFNLAEERGDLQNMELIALSFAEFYIDDRWSLRNAEIWLRRFRKFAETIGDGTALSNVRPLEKRFAAKASLARRGRGS